MNSARLYHTLASHMDNEDCMLATIIDGEYAGAKRLIINGSRDWESDGAAEDAIWSEVLFAMKDQQGSSLLTIQGNRVFCERIGSTKKLVICGGGHVSIPIIRLGRQVGFHVTVLEDRPKFADDARLAGADAVICDSFANGLAQIAGSKDTYFVIVTRGHRYDGECLRAIFKKERAYVGMMGSRLRVAIIKNQLKEEGMDEETVNELHAPIGLSIDAETPEEIAISIMAELIQVKNRRKRVSSYSADLLEKLCEEAPAGKRVLATIVSRRGSAPREIGTKMLVSEDGSIVGTIGGGCAESMVMQQCLAMMRSESRPQLVTVNMTKEDAEDEGMVCGGTIEVFLEQIV